MSRPTVGVAEGASARPDADWGEIVGFYPEGTPSRNSQRPGQNPGLRGGLEIVFNQQ
ncbi:hypothetical protein ES332_D10G080400v1 [Gossypium tomentosum]|uniref:Uncharacterized protein n=1 Tax=Gossypium tomentosum TaxID=34277 RepID=A0A5D2J3M9_GOSTO|nr:hypothetical protein ES332_D10G080400v1 [Gossypium tomentosum]